MEYIAQTLKDSGLVHGPRASPTTQAVITNRINNVLVCCLAAQLREMGHSVSTWECKDVVPLTLRPGMCLKYVVRHRDREHLLQGSCDYALWYGYGDRFDEKTHRLGFNFVIYETKISNASCGEPQCLGYMGIVHDVRRRAGMKGEAATVYGLSTDSFWFHFLRIDEHGKVSYRNCFPPGILPLG